MINTAVKNRINVDTEEDKTTASIQQNDDKEEMTSLYLASAFGIEFCDRLGVQFIWGENNRIVDNKLVLEGKVATFTIDTFRRNGKPENLFIKPNIGLMIIDKIDNNYYFASVLHYQWSEVGYLHMKRVADFLTGNEVCTFDAEDFLSAPEKHNRYLIGSTATKSPIAIRVPKREIELLVELSWYTGGTLNRCGDGAFSEYNGGEIDALINRLYNEFIGVDFTGYRLLDKSPERFEDYGLIDLRGSMPDGMLGYPDIKPYDLDSTDVIQRDPRLEGDFDQLLKRLKRVENTKINIKGNFVEIYYMGKVTDSRFKSGYTYLESPRLTFYRDNDKISISSYVVEDSTTVKEKGYNKFLRSINEIFYVFGVR